MKYINLYVLIFAAIFGIFTQEANGQDPHLAQFYMAPLQLNPAMTGIFEGRWRVNANYRDQWSSILKNVPFRTIAAGFDARYRIAGNDFMAFGLSALRDEVGNGNFLTNRGHLSLSYIKQMAGGGYRSTSQYLIAGAQFGVGQHSVDWNQFWFSTQFDGSALAPNTNINSNEPGISGESANTDLYLDFNAGLMWYAVFDKDASIWAGIAANHLNSPDISFFDGATENLYVRWVGHLGGEIPFSSQLSMLPAIAVMSQGPHFSTRVGANFRYTNHDWNEVAIRAGAWPHLVRKVTDTGSGLSMDAITVALILELNRVNFGLSYDITTSTLRAANNSRGAFELSAIYIHPAQTRIKTVCPKF